MEDKQITEVREKLMSVLELVEKFELLTAETLGLNVVYEGEVENEY